MNHGHSYHRSIPLQHCVEIRCGHPDVLKLWVNDDGAIHHDSLRYDASEFHLHSMTSIPAIPASTNHAARGPCGTTLASGTSRPGPCGLDSCLTESPP